MLFCTHFVQRKHRRWLYRDSAVATCRNSGSGNCRAVGVLIHWHIVVRGTIRLWNHCLKAFYHMVCPTLYLDGRDINNRKWKFGLSNLLNDYNTKCNSMINRRVSLFCRVLFERIPPYGLSVYLRRCLCSVSRHQWTGWSKIIGYSTSIAIDMDYDLARRNISFNSICFGVLC